jgi:hypothetical protein
VCVDDPVIDAVSGIYRLGIDFVTRRVVIDSTIIKLQVWDGNALGTSKMGAWLLQLFRMSVAR